MKKKSARGRDRQRSKVYAWEEVASKGAWKVPTFQTLDQCQAWLDPIWRRERGRYGRARVPCACAIARAFARRSTCRCGVDRHFGQVERAGATGKP